jgi:oligopeptide transport system ATP-binding protein
MTDSPGTGPLLSVSDLAVSFTVGSMLAARIKHEQRQLRAIDGVDLTIARGEALALVGESGSGKSTFALALAGLRPVDRGEIRFDGRVLPSHRSRADQRRIQMVFQDPYSSLNPRLTVGGMLRELLKVHHIVPAAEADAYCKRLLGMVGLGEDAMRAYPRQFSGGQRQRVAIARALVLRPDVLVADEPVSALDVSVQATILNLLRDLRGELGLTLMLISHNLAVVRHLCDRVAVMYLGRIVEEGPAEEVHLRPRHPYTQALLSAIPVPDVHRPAGSQRIVLTGEVANPLDPPSGCTFHPRCPYAMDICRAVEPEPFVTSVGTTVRCHLHTSGPVLDGAPVATAP